MIRSAPRRRPSVEEAGFSFIEILIVMGIIAVLAGMVVVAVMIASKKGPEMQTRAKVQQLMAMANKIKNDWGGTWPPTDLKMMQMVSGGAGQAIKRIPNQTNLGGEALYQAIYWPGVQTEAQFGEGDLGNTDEDSMDVAIGRGKELTEIVDAWKNPIVYIPFTEYASAWDKPHQYVNAKGETVDARPYKTERGFDNPQSCQIYSMGLDGQPNTDDDIKGWEK